MSEDLASTPLPAQPPLVPDQRPVDQRLQQQTAAMAVEAGAKGAPGSPAGATGATDPKDSAGSLATGAVAVVRSFNEAATRTGLAILVDAANETAGDKIRAAARAVVETPAQAEDFAQRVMLPPALRTAAVDSGVELCRENNWNIGPGWALGGIFLEFMRRLGSVTAELEQLARLRAKAKPQDKPNGGAA